MARNYEYEDLHSAVFEELVTMADSTLPDPGLRVQTPMERATDAFAAEEIVSGYVEDALDVIAGKLKAHADDGPKSRKAGLLWAASLLVGENA